jgi:hypothetical protein
MKTLISLCSVTALVVQCAQAQTPSFDNPNTQAAPPPDVMTWVGPPGKGVYAISHAAAHQRQWARTVAATLPDGTTTTVTNSYIEIASGMNAWSPTEQKWVEASDEIELIGPNQTPVARKAQHQVIFSPQLLGSPPQDTIDTLLADGKRLQSHVVGIAYTDTKSGKSVFIAETKDTPAELIGRTQVLYADAFDTIDASIRYTMTRASFEQDILFRQQLPFPDELRAVGFAPETTRVEVWTAFTTATPPNRRPIEIDGKILEGDEHLDFGPNSMAFGPSQAYKVDDSLATPSPAPMLGQERTRLSMEWVVADGQQFLVESMPFFQAEAIAKDLPKPQASAVSLDQSKLRALAKCDSKARIRPASVLLAGGPNRDSQRTSVARADGGRRRGGGPAALWDYVTINGATGYHFQSDSTYYVTANAYFYGTTYFEGNTVIKFDHLNPNLSLATPRIILMSGGPISCQTAPWHPAHFTAKDDNSIGDYISGSTGSPSGYYAYECICLWDLGTAGDVHDMRFCWAYVGFGDEWRQQSVVRDAQFINCYVNTSCYQATNNLRNALCYNSSYGLVGQYSTITAENVTFSVGTQLIYNIASSSFFLTNCLIAAFSNTSGYSGTVAVHDQRGDNREHGS